MSKDIFVKLSYRFFYWFVRFWYQLTVRRTKVDGVRLPHYYNAEQVAVALDWGTKWKEDPLNGIFDYMPHPTKVQDNINNKKSIDDCDGHAIYWGTSLLWSDMATRAWIGTLHMKKKDGSIMGHCICIFKDLDNKFYWCDYSNPQSFESLEMFDWVDSVCNEFEGAKPISAGFFEIVRVERDFTPVFSSKTSVKVF